MTNILYIHGYGSDANSTTGGEIRNALDESFKVVTHSFSNDYGTVSTMIDNIELARNIIETQDINQVVASSMGAFIAMNCTGVTKILINPCMKPSEQLRLRVVPDISGSELKKYEDLEASIDISNFDFNNTYGFFATRDELFSYMDLFNSFYNPDNCFTFDGEHRISATNIHKEIIPKIYDIRKSK